MAITTDTLKMFASERMTDNADGGGQMSANEIVLGASNQIFDDMSDVDRASGDLSLRKVYAAVTSADTDKYLDAGVVILKPPEDPSVGVMLFSNGDYYDERADWVGLLESSVSRGRRYAGWLYGTHIVGQRALLIWMRPGSDAPPSAGARLNVVALTNGVETHTEFVWVTKVTIASRTITDDRGQYAVDEITCDLAYPLTYAYAGIDPSRTDPASTQVAGLIYETRYNPDLVTLSGIKPLALAAATNDYSVKVAGGLYQALIPTGLQETAIPDTNPAADNALLVAGSADASTVVTLSTTLAVVKPDASLFLGSACFPGSLNLTVSGATITDTGGVVYLGGVTAIGLMDYQNGIATFNSSCPDYGTATKTITFRPAVKVLRPGNTASIRVTAENRGYIYVLTLTPIPSPGSLRISYQVSKNWYTLYEDGSGTLSGLDSSYGAGVFNGITGTVTITTGALPDVDSDILLVWGVQVDFTQRGNLTLNPIAIKGAVVNGLPVRPGSFSLAWESVSVADDEKGGLSGTGGTGTLNPVTGEWTIIPTTLPAPGTELAADYEYVTEGVRSFIFDEVNAVDNSNGTITITVTDATDDFEPKSVQITLYVVATGTPAPTEIVDGYRLANAETPYRRVILHDDGLGAILNGETSIGTVDYITHAITLDADFYGTLPVGAWYRKYAVVGTWTDPETEETINKYDWVQKWIDCTPQETTVWLETTLSANTVYYNLVSDFPDVETETTVINQLTLDVTRGFQETISGLEFSIGTSRFVELNRQIFLNPDFSTGQGTLAGTLDASTGETRLATWTGGVTNAPFVKSLVTSRNVQLVSSVIFRTPVSNLRPGSAQLRAYDELGNLISDTIPESGVLANTNWTIGADYPAGVIRARFGRWKVDADLTPTEKLESWYDPDAVVNIGGVDKIWKPTLVRAESIIYNAVAQSILPPDREMLKIDASRLPPDGQALIYQQGKLGLVHHTDALTQSSLSPTQEIDCGRTRLYRVVIEDADQQRLPASFYSVNRELGLVTMAADLDLTGYTGPYTLYHTIADLARITSIDISGVIGLNKKLSHDYPIDGTYPSYFSGVLYAGTLQARYTNLFAQTTWTDVWSDTRIGDAPLAQYNDTLFPPVVSNLGTYKDRLLFKFTSSTTFQCFGENLGLIGTGDTTVNFSPVNPLTGQPYVTMDYRGWGGFANGNCLRLNLIGANYPVNAIRAIQPSEPTGLDNSFELSFIGNVDS